MATKFGTSMTQLTTEALEILLELGESEKFRQLTHAERKALILDASTHAIEQDLPDQPRLSQLNMEGLETIGLIRERVEILLRNNPKHEFTTNDIAEILNIPQSTARTYVRDIHEDSPSNFILLRGRPNKIYYKTE